MKKVKDNKTYYFQCDCMSQEHTFGIEFDAEDKEAVIHVQLCQYRSFFKRLVVGIKYVFGYKSKYGHWDTTMLDEEKFMDLYNLMTRYIHTVGFTNKAAIKIQQGLKEIKDGKNNTAVPSGLHSSKDRDGLKNGKYKKA